MMDALYKRIRELREAQGLSLREAADRSGGQISHAHLRALEVGHDTRSKNSIRPTPDTLRVVADIYHADYNELMELAGYIEPKNDETLAARWPNLSPDRREKAAKWETASKTVGTPTLFGRDMTNEDFDRTMGVMTGALIGIALAIAKEIEKDTDKNKAADPQD